MTALQIELTEPDEDDAAPDQVVLFTVAGQDYLVDADPDASALLRYMWNAKVDELSAIRDVLVEQLGGDAYQRLMNTKGISKGAFQSIVTAVLTHLGGDDGDPKAPPAANRAARRQRKPAADRGGAKG